MMTQYHQPYSEIMNMPTRLINFLVNLANAEFKKGEQDIKDIKTEANKYRRRVK